MMLLIYKAKFTVFFAGKSYRRKNLHTRRKEKKQVGYGAMNYGRKYKSHRGTMTP